MAIAYRPEFLAPLNFDTCAVLYLSQLYWLAKERFKGTFYQSKDQLKEQTGLNRYRQDKCRSAVIKAGFVSVETRYEGTHRRTYFCVDVERLDRLIGKIKDAQKSLNKEQIEKEAKATKAGSALQYRNNAKPVTMGLKWEPSPELMAVACTYNNIDPDFIRTELPQFVAYHLGNTATDFDARFIAHLKRQWPYMLQIQQRAAKIAAAQDKLTSAKTSNMEALAAKYEKHSTRQHQTTEERLTDTTWAEKYNFDLDEPMPLGSTITNNNFYPFN